jgi:deoxyribodipyrimidine photo-lyase
LELKYDAADMNTSAAPSPASGAPKTIDISQLGIPLALQDFPPTFEAAFQRASSISPSQYARSRNALDGAVTGLSPYLTHGIVSLPQVAQQVAQKYKLSYEDKLIFEFGWREFFHHVWSRTPAPENILRDMRSANLWRGKYADELPADIREGRTGVKVIDAAVRQLYATGYLHNHARMWLASYCVHLRKVHWRAGADWLYAHLLDGDLPSNHLSWQWVAATFSSKPYLFNAANVAKYAPEGAWKAWASNKTAVDLSYEELDTFARESADVGAEPGVHAAVQEPELAGSDLMLFLEQKGLLAGIEHAQPATNLIANRIQSNPAKRIELIHPWALAEPPSSAAKAPANQRSLRVGIIQTAMHTAHPWSERRWRFVLTRMREICDCIWIGDAADLAKILGWPNQERVFATHTLHANYRDALPRLAQICPELKLFANPQKLCNSFSRFYETVQREQRDFSKLLQPPEQNSLL